MPVTTNIAADEAGMPVLTSEEIFAGTREVIILHKGVPYRLRITRQDKLILTK